MEKINVGNVKINNFVLGAGNLGDPSRKTECFSITDKYLEMGYNTLDVARSYKDGACEEFMGEYLSKRDRNKTVLISKGGFPLSRLEMYKTRLSEKEMRKDLESSLKALKTDFLDIYFLHRDDVFVPAAEMLETMNKFVREGKVREIGASNWTCGRIAEANAYAAENGLKPFTVSQINFSYAHTTPAQTGDVTHIVMNNVEYEWYEETQLPIIAYSVQAKGFFSKQYSGRELKQSGKVSYLHLPENFRRAERIKQLSEEKNMPIPALLISYVLSKKLNCAAIGGFSSVAQLEESEPGARIKLTDKELDFLEGKEKMSL